MKLVVAGVIFCMGVLPASLLLARVHPFGDVGLYAEGQASTPLMSGAQVPAEVRAILAEKCADCHSAQTHAQYYGHFAPVSWLLERDVMEARKAMNLSQWESYSADQKQMLVAKMVQETKTHEMPPVQYRMIHWNARMEDADLRVLGGWAHEFQTVQAGAGIGGEGDPARGKALFEKRCTGCHTLTQNREGPRLQGVYGRTSGAVAGFAYSEALRKAQVIWDEGSLEKWLADPDAFIAGNEMDFLVAKAQERRDLIRYLRQSSGKQRTK
ncbi:MAG: heme-binding domain-containing protein [Terracidiphilus sp.]